MTKRMLIDATHAEETRVVVADGTQLVEFDYETSTKKQLKGNIYLAKVTRVEPSLQAAFVDFGGNRHGFLAFNEIHPDYYRIPVEDREALIAETGGDSDLDEGEEEDGKGDGESVEVLDGDDADEIQEIGDATRQKLRSLTRQYKIQEVIKRRQILLVQVVKEERGNKGAALTTYLSLPGRYCVLMPNTARGGGISRKVSNPAQRKQMKAILSDLDVPDGMAVIMRTAGVGRSKSEIRRDYEYLRRLWDDIREQTLQSSAPALIYEEGDVIKRSLRDSYNRDIDEVLIEGEDAYKAAKALMKTMIPSHAKRVQKYAETDIPLFNRYQIESQLDEIYDTTVTLKSGGYLVINPTEALVAIDVNSGRATRQRNVESTARQTNLEAAEEIARQLRLRDLAGLIVIDFIDMDENRNNAAVERKLKEAMKTDRARIQIGRISPFGLLELSRQRLRPSLTEASSQSCPMCGGSGNVRSTESTALRILRAIEDEGIRKRSSELSVVAPTAVALYLLNQKRHALNEIEARYDFRVFVEADHELVPPDFKLDRVQQESEAGERDEQRSESRASEEEERGGRRRRRGRRRRDEEADTERSDEQVDAQAEDDDSADGADFAEAGSDESQGEERGSRRRRGRRGGRRRRRTEDGASDGAETQDDQAAQQAEADDEESAKADAAESDGDKDGEDKPRRRRGRRGRRAAGSDAKTDEATADTGDSEAASDANAEAGAADDQAGDDASADDKDGDDKDAEKKPRRRRRPRRSKADQDGEAAEAAAQEAAEAADEAPAEAAASETGTVEAEVAEVEAAEPEVAESEVAEPEVAEPETAEPAAAEGDDDAETRAADAPMANGDDHGATGDNGHAGEADDSSPSHSEDAAYASEDQTDEDEQPAPAAESEPPAPRPQRRGWWNRVVG